jgi:hypothetical protein
MTAAWASSSRLGAALRLYEGLGFQHAAMPAADRARYATADVFMALELDAVPAPPRPSA